MIFKIINLLWVFVAFVVVSACHSAEDEASEKMLFTLLPVSQTQVDFSNTL